MQMSLRKVKWGRKSRTSRKKFFTVSVTQVAQIGGGHFILGNSQKPSGHRSERPALGGPAWAAGVDQMTTFRDCFQFQPFCDSGFFMKTVIPLEENTKGVAFTLFYSSLYTGMCFREVWSFQSTLWGEKARSMPWKLTFCWKPAGFALLCPTNHCFNGTVPKGCTRPCVVPASPAVTRIYFFPRVSANACWLRGAGISWGIFFFSLHRELQASPLQILLF